MEHLVLVGDCYLDTILSVPHYPDEDSKLRAATLAVRRGGNCPNSLEVLEQLLGAHGEDHVRTNLVSPLPRRSSPATRRIHSSFGPGSRVDLDHCLYRDACTEPASSYIIRSEATGSRTIVNYSNLPEMTTGEFEAVALAFASHPDTWWHFEGRIPETTLACMRLLRVHLPTARISVELEKPGRRGLTELAAEADVVFYSRSWAESRGHQSAEACLTGEQRQHRSLGLCTWGADGAAAMSQPLGPCLRFPVEIPPGGIPVVEYVVWPPSPRAHSGAAASGARVARRAGAADVLPASAPSAQVTPSSPECCTAWCAAKRRGSSAKASGSPSTWPRSRCSARALAASGPTWQRGRRRDSPRAWPWTPSPCSSSPWKHGPLSRPPPHVQPP